MGSVRKAAHQSGRGVIQDWRPEDPAFWAGGEAQVANRNLAISVPALLLALVVVLPSRRRGAVLIRERSDP